MRRDMAKIIVERPRHGHSDKNYMIKKIRRDKSYRSYQRNNQMSDDTDQEDIDTEDDCHVFSGYKASIKPRGVGPEKWLSENLKPLLRFIETRVGKTWDEVRSEISLNIKADNPVQVHIMDHVKSFVKTENSSGWVLDENNLPRSIGYDGYTPYIGYYVDRKGFLRKSKKSDFREFDQKAPEKYSGCYIVRERKDHPFNTLFLTKSKNGNWYFVRVVDLNGGYFSDNKLSPQELIEVADSAIDPAKLLDLDSYIRSFISANWWNFKKLENKRDIYDRGKYPTEIWQASEKEVDETLSGLYVEVQSMRF